MKKLFIILVSVMAMILLFTGCVGKDVETNKLTKEEKLEDFRFMAKTFDENYCNSDVFYDKNKVKFESLTDDFEKAIQNTNSDIEFYNILNSYLSLLEDGHVGVVSPQLHSEWSNWEFFEEELPYLNDVLNNKEVKESYKYWASLTGETESINKFKNDISKKTGKALNGDNVSTDIIDGVAYMKVRSFSKPSFTEKDEDSIRELYKNLNDYDDFIIDIRGNGGGATEVWMNYIVAPIIDREYSCTNYSLYKDGDITKEYHKSRNRFSRFKDIDEFPDKELLSKVSNKDDFKYFDESYLIVNPGNNVFPDKSNPYKGNIYLLVDEKVFSSAEAFTLFSKQTGWAKVVGINTAGDGVGVDPPFFNLPNSKLIIRFTTEKGLNPDGSSNSSVGTTPDIKVDNLDYLLDYIKSN
jgi:hypothetical protein